MPQVQTIPATVPFVDALAAGLLAEAADGAFALQFATFLASEREVTIVADRDLSMLTGNEKWLGLADGNFAGGGISHVAD